MEVYKFFLILKYAIPIDIEWTLFITVLYINITFHNIHTVRSHTLLPLIPCYRIILESEQTKIFTLYFLRKWLPTAFQRTQNSNFPQYSHNIPFPAFHSHNISLHEFCFYFFLILTIPSLFTHRGRQINWPCLYSQRLRLRKSFNITSVLKNCCTMLRRSVEISILRTPYAVSGVLNREAAVQLFVDTIITRIYWTSYYNSNQCLNNFLSSCLSRYPKSSFFSSYQYYHRNFQMTLIVEWM